MVLPCTQGAAVSSYKDGQESDLSLQTRWATLYQLFWSRKASSPAPPPLSPILISERGTDSLRL